MVKLRYAPRIWLIPAVMLVFLGLLSFWVWQRQIDNQALLLARHTDDVALQAARRLEVFMAAELRAANVFARRWSEHEDRDFSKERFERFAQILIQDLPGFQAVGLLSPAYKVGWASPAAQDVLARFQRLDQRPLLAQLRQNQEPNFAEPYLNAQGVTNIAAIFPLLRPDEFLGFMLVQFSAVRLIDTCFHTRIRAEFHFAISDGDRLLFRSSPLVNWAVGGQAAPGVSQGLQVLNRRWQLRLWPKPELAASYGWGVGIPIFLFGIMLSLGFSWLVLLLLRRMEMLRWARDQQAQLARKVLHVQEEERARLSRDLHDELGQLLTALRLEIDWLEKRLPSGCATEVGVMENATTLIEGATTELRRMCSGLRPPLLDDLGIEAALASLVKEFEERMATGIDLGLDLDQQSPALAPELALCTYRILQESLTNIRRHAQADQAWVQLTVRTGTLTLSIRDDGVGFVESQLEARQGLGIEGMRERAHLVGGTVAIESSPKRGTTVVFRAPTTVPAQEEKA